MYDTKISQLPEINVTDPNALLVIVTSGTTYKIPFSALTSTIFSNVDELYLPVLSSDTNYVSSQIFQTPSGNVRVKDLAPVDLGTEELFGVHAGETDNIVSISSTGSVNYGYGLTHQNNSSGQSASSDIVIIGDTGDYEQGYIDMGVNSSTYSGFTGVFALGGPSDAYLFSTSNDLYIGNALPNKKLVLFNGGFNTNENSVLYVHEDKSITINTNYVDPLNPSALRVVNANQTSTSMIHSDSNINDFAEIISVNTNTGDTASADIVAQNSIGEINPDEGYIDMGINGPNYTSEANIGAAGDAYLYSTGNDLYLGNASEGKKVILFNGGFDTILNAKMYIHEDGTITMNTAYVDPNNPAALRIVNPNSGSTSMIIAESNINNFAEIISVNTNNGDSATSKITARNDMGNEDPTMGFISMGINSTGYNVPGSIGLENDAYLYSTGDDFYIGNASPGRKLVLFNGGADTTAYAKFFIHEDASITINTAEVDFNNPAAIRVVNANGTTSMIHCDGSIDDYSEIASVNTDSGNNASADITCANDLGNIDSNQGYINMGINSTTYNIPDNVGGPNDAYIFGTGNSFYIGNASENTSSNTYIFTNGKNDDAVRIAVKHDGTIGLHNFYPEYPLDVSGDTRIVGQLILPSVIDLNFPNDSAAELGGVYLGGLYHTNGTVKIRIT